MSDTVASTPTRHFEGVELPAPGNFTIDPSHSDIGFVVRHLMVSKVRGSFGSFDATLTIAEDPLDSGVEVTIDAASVDTGDDGRDTHLRSGDFFDVEQHPSIEFRSTALRHTGGGSLELDGELVIRGVARTVTLSGQVEGTVVDPWGNQRFVVSASVEVDRELWGLTWNQALETGGVLVSRKVVLEVDAQFVRSG